MYPLPETRRNVLGERFSYMSICDIGEELQILQPRLKDIIVHENNFFNLSQIKTVKNCQIFILKVK